jgi:hypothetical protein
MIKCSQTLSTNRHDFIPLDFRKTGQCHYSISQNGTHRFSFTFTSFIYVQSSQSKRATKSTHVMTTLRKYASSTKIGSWNSRADSSYATYFIGIVWNTLSFAAMVLEIHFRTSQITSTRHWWFNLLTLWCDVF